MDDAGEEAGRILMDAINEGSRAVYEHYGEEDARTADSFLNMFGDGNAEEQDDDFTPMHVQPVHSDNPIEKLEYELSGDELDEHVRERLDEHFKPKPKEKRVRVDPATAEKVYNCLRDILERPVKLPSDYDRMLIKAHRRMRQSGKAVPQLGTQQKEIEPLRVTAEQEQTTMEFLKQAASIGFCSSLCLETSRVIVFDSMKYPRDNIEQFLQPLNRQVYFIYTKHNYFWIEYLPFILMHRVWKAFVKNFKNQLDVRMYFPITQIRDEVLQVDKIMAVSEYLISIDDIWSVEAWEHIQSALPRNDNGSRVITTTRSKTVAKSCCAGIGAHMYEAQPHGDDDSQRKFFKGLFCSREDCPQDLRKVSSDILKKCGGLPLAIISIAGLLANRRQTVEVWLNTLKSISAAVDKDSHIDKMKRILLLSYFDLPPHLKSCLLYLSVFPEDYLIDCRELILLWVAERLIPARDSESTEQLGRSYLNYLINRSLVQPVKVGADGATVKECRVHDVILEFIVSKAVENNFVTIWNRNGFSLKIILATRFVVYLYRKTFLARLKR
ncbi:hypothetical protein C2845_PM17G05700 [Panicum miliaceum]|uniref:Uncharacterized protein n=1 Tax=Panicum miliaceum TaxID=4540 RepID=A0A3L6Q456_PANMI|nr:hypothetical protein C2845_PM17G05700 [Panicum miliaceum]